MGVSSDVYALIAKKLGKKVSEVTDADVDVYLEGQKAGSKNSSKEKTEATTPIDTAKTSAGFSLAGPLIDLKDTFIGVGDEADKITKAFSLEGIGESVDVLIKGAQDLSNSMGIGRARAAEFRAMIADSVPEMQKLGITQEDALTYMSQIPKALGVNTTLTKETIVEISSAAKLTNSNAGVLANNFKNVGFNLSEVGDKMAEVANYAKSIGANVVAVTTKLVTNLGQLNILNFDGGIKGLAKMVGQSEMLGINMAEVLRKGESLLNPESAIEFSAALQRLGVQSSALLDPLSAMDMALNDPAALQNEMVKISQQFTKLKADGSGFEILPGAKLQLREVAVQLGMSAEELANMSIKSADLEMKMSQIRFPGFAASEEDRMLIANMSQMKDGRAMVTIAKEDGGTEEVAVEDLTANQLEKLKEEQADQNKTIEEIQRDQLTVLEEIAANMKGTVSAASMGVASTGAVQRMTNLSNELRRTVTSVVSEKFTTENVRGKVSPIAGELEKGVVQGISQGDITVLFESLSKLPELLTNSAGSVAGGTIDAFKNLVEGVNFAVLDEYKDISGVKPGETNISRSLLDLLSTAGGGLEYLFGKGTGTEQTKTLNINQKIDVTGDGSQIGKDHIYKINYEWLDEVTRDPAVMNKLSQGMETSMSSSGMAK